MKIASEISSAQSGANHVADRGSVPALFLPERKPAEWAITAAVFVLSTAYLLLFRHYSFSADEGVTLQAAQRILNGQVMYRDFFYFCTPGSYYLLALLFRVFGDSLGVARTALAVYGGVFALLTYLIARRVCSRWSALLAASMVTTAVLPSLFFALHNWDSTLWAYLSLYCAVWFLQSLHWGWALGMGTFCSFTVLFEQSKGAGLLLGLVVGFGILEACRQIDLKRAQVLAALAGLAWPVVITCWYFASQYASRQMIADLIHPLQHYAAVNAVPYGYLYWAKAFSSESPARATLILFLSNPYFLISALPIFGAGVLGYSTVRTWRMRGLGAERWSYYVLVSACTSGLFLGVIAARKDAGHFAFVAPILSLILCWFMDGSDIRLCDLDFIRPVAVGAVVFTFTLLGFSQLLTANGLATRETRRGVVKVPAAETALDYVRAHTRPGEDIFVYPYYPTYYYLTGTSNPTRYDFLHPGLNTLGQVKEALDAIATRRPRVVLFETSFFEDIVIPFPSMPIRVLASPDPVSKFILKEYRPCAALITADSRHFVFMVRKDLPCPGRERRNGGSEVGGAETAGRPFE
jgi:hypothetical protein